MPSLIEEINAADDSSTLSEGLQPEGTGPQTETVEAEASPEGAAEGQEVTEAGEPAPSSDELLAKIAEAEGLNIEDPRHRKIAERLRDEHLKAGEQPEELTEFERQAMQPAAQQQQPPPEQRQPPQQQPPPAAPAPGPQRYGDIGDEWKGPSDALQAEAQAWSDVTNAIENKQDPRMAMDRLHAVRQAQFVRLADANLIPFFQQILPQVIRQEATKLMQEQIGGVMPDLQSSVAEKRMETARREAMQDLKKTKGFEGVEDLYKEGEGNLQFRDPATGQFSSVKNTPLNAVLIKNPEILQIQVPHQDPAIAMRLTFTARLKAAMRLQNAGRIKPQTATNLMAAGKQQAARAIQDRTRQGLNAGSGANNGAGKPGSHVKDLQNIPGEGSSFAEAFK